MGYKSPTQTLALKAIFHPSQSGTLGLGMGLGPLGLGWGPAWVGWGETEAGFLGLRVRTNSRL